MEAMQSMIKRPEFLSKLIQYFKMRNYIELFQSEDTKLKITKLLPCCCLREIYPLCNLWLRLCSQTNVTQINLLWNQWDWCSNIFLYMDLNVSSIIWLNQLKLFLLKTSTAQGGKKSFLSRAWGGLLLCTLKCLLCSKKILGSVDWQQEKFSWQRRKPEEIHMQTKF